MKIDQLIADIDTMKTMVERWNKSDAVPTIERDITLTNLQNIYKQILALPSQVVANTEYIEKEEEHGKVEFIIDEEVEQHKETEPEIVTDTYPEPVIEEQVEPEPQLRELFGQSVTKELVDTFVMELFWRDEHFFANEVSKLSQMPNLDAALFYICEKYNWNADSIVAERFTELLANHKFE